MAAAKPFDLTPLRGFGRELSRTEGAEKNRAPTPRTCLSLLPNACFWWLRLKYEMRWEIMATWRFKVE
jgi:hypothetical protein